MANLKFNQLSAAFVAKATKPGKYTDGHGLMLWIQPSGSRQWVQRLTIRGNRHEIGLGGAPVVTLAMARKRALENRRMVYEGGDPRKPATAPTFAVAARKVHALHLPTWRAVTAAKWLQEMENHVFPTLGKRTIDSITMQHVKEVIEPIWVAKPMIAKRLCRRIETVMKWAITEGYRRDNPADNTFQAGLPKVRHTQKHQEALPYSEVASALATVHDSNEPIMRKLAIELLALTATRPFEVLEAQWAEFDLDAATWTIPASTAKKDREHRVPLSDSAIAVLRQAQARNATGLVFLCKGKPIPKNGINRIFVKLNIKAVGHGFRSSFREWCGETAKAREVAEAALAHKVRDQTEAAYARSDLFDRRRELMQQWADYLNQ